MCNPHSGKKANPLGETKAQLSASVGISGEAQLISVNRSNEAWDDLPHCSPRTQPPTQPPTEPPTQVTSSSLIKSRLTSTANTCFGFSEVVNN